MRKLERPIIVKIYLDAEEKKLLDVKVKESKMRSTTAFLRHLIKYGFVYFVDYEELREMVRQIHGVAVNINQVAHRINATESIYKSDMEELKKELDEIWGIVRKYLADQPLREQ